MDKKKIIAVEENEEDFPIERIRKRIQDERNVRSKKIAYCDREDLRVVMVENLEISYEG